VFDDDRIDMPVANGLKGFIRFVELPPQFLILS
jgi:hypothetical protein